MADDLRPRDVLDFWFAAGERKWFAHDPEFDAEVSGRFAALVTGARRNGLAEWEATPDGALAAVIALDQFPRNIFRGEPRAFASDADALTLAERAIERGFDVEVPASARRWFYLPFMHSEDPAMQERCVDLCRRGELRDGTLEYAIGHAAIIRRFGRFPHRNVILGRRSTDEEIRFLEDGGFAG